jgi:TPR repeat protein
MSTFKLQISLCAATAQFPRDGRGVAQDSAEAKRYFIMAAERGNLEAMFQLGEMYQRKWEVQEPGSNWYQ